ncbi:MAG: YggS family pyridoxal phosphate-dependent enzyme [Azonexus sp.]|jgi:pyridoxal phosphate enzyme (YggS family)|uniref:YggS family pyridoxal phosphate-dependent enzyme n=1 Tax=Azonexus sp. TaxID=1872668 RepID=UPI002830E1A2|nr:YggS family pyridoxal phosphate-dependent enzyme [Azonexus sp.]MDR0777207.1 YggS family pyridoxal phosphate-dependent enzyme [Azonexus sp.]
MSAIAGNLQAVLVRIADACRHSGRPPDSVRLLAVSKTWPLDCVLAAATAGQRAFGENYVQEGTAKAVATRDRDLEWHFIGPLQSNKTRTVAEHFAWVHSIDRLKIAERLAAQRPAELPPLQVCVQVNVSGEASKSGCRPDEATALCRAVAALPHLRLRGLMAIPEPSDDVAAQRAPFRHLRELAEEMRAAGLAIDTLSMGMSHDLEAAVAEGATIVRIGTAIFGERQAQTP